MGQMNAMGHVLCVSAGGDLDELWQLGDELAARLVEHFGPDAGHSNVMTVHGLSEGEDAPNRCCVHPTSSPAVEFRSVTLRGGIELAVVWLAKQLPEGELWRRD